MTTKSKAKVPAKAREISIGHTPDADDAFMFYGIASGKVKSSFKIKHVIQDIETLNKRALSHDLDVTAVSAHAFAYLKDYAILRSGSSFGLDYGPIVISTKKMSTDELKKCTIAIPGKLTSANLLLNLAIGKFKGKEMSFESIPQAVIDGKADAGLVIHEAQITYDRGTFFKVLDLGKWWSSETDGLPVPLGINVASTRNLNQKELKEVSQLLSDSIAYALDNVKDAVEYAMQYGRGQPTKTITKFVKMYVNRLTVDMGSEGKKSIEKVFSMASKRDILPEGKIKVTVV